jgi:hypothetical protein
MLSGEFSLEESKDDEYSRRHGNEAEALGHHRDAQKLSLRRVLHSSGLDNLGPCSRNDLGCLGLIAAPVLLLEALQAFRLRPERSRPTFFSGASSPLGIPSAMRRAKRYSASSWRVSSEPRSARQARRESCALPGRRSRVRAARRCELPSTLHVEELQEFVGGQLDLLVPPLGRAEVAGDDARAVQAAEVAEYEGVAGLRLVRGAVGEPKMPLPYSSHECVSRKRFSSSARGCASPQSLSSTYCRDSIRRRAWRTARSLTLYEAMRSLSGGWLGDQRPGHLGVDLALEAMGSAGGDPDRGHFL